MPNGREFAVQHGRQRVYTRDLHKLVRVQVSHVQHMHCNFTAVRINMSYLFSLYGAQVASGAAGGLLAVAGAHGQQDSLAAELAEGGRFPGLYMMAAHPEPRVRVLVRNSCRIAVCKCMIGQPARNPLVPFYRPCLSACLPFAVPSPGLLGEQSVSKPSPGLQWNRPLRTCFLPSPPCIRSCPHTRPPFAAQTPPAPGALGLLPRPPPRRPAAESSPHGPAVRMSCPVAG